MDYGHKDRRKILPFIWRLLCQLMSSDSELTEYWCTLPESLTNPGDHFEVAIRSLLTFPKPQLLLAVISFLVAILLSTTDDGRLVAWI